MAVGCVLLLACVAICYVALVAASVDLDVGGLKIRMPKEHVLDSNNFLLNSCGEVVQEVDGYIYSHAEAITATVGLDVNYGETINCTLSIDVSSPVGTDAKVLLRFLEDVKLAKGNAAGNGTCDQLRVYDGLQTDQATLIKTYCGDAMNVVAVESSGPQITLQFLSNTDGETSSGFRIFYSAFKDATANGSCSTQTELSCDQHRCLPEVLVCDGVDHCLDATDEKSKVAGCSALQNLAGYVFGLGLYTLVGMLVALVVLITFLCLAIYCCCCQKKKVAAI